MSPQDDGKSVEPSQNLGAIGLPTETMDWSNMSLTINPLDIKNSTISDCVVIVGDENAKDVIIGDDDLDCTGYVIPENEITLVSSTMDREVPVSKDNVKVVLIHVGTASFDKGIATNVNDIFDQYQLMLQQVSVQYHNAKILVSSVLPRAKQNLYQEEFERVNLEITRFNDLVKNYCDGDECLQFLDNDVVFKTDFEVSDHLYKIHNESGIHLGRQGLIMLEDIFKDAIRDAYYEQKLQADYNVRLST